MGRGRTTTGTIIGTLLYLRKLGAFPPRARCTLQPGPDGAQPAAPDWFATALANAPPVGEQTKDKLKWGMYDVVRSLLRWVRQVYGRCGLGGAVQRGGDVRHVGRKG